MSVESELRVARTTIEYANARADRWKKRTDEARAQVARVEALRATMPHALDCGIPCNCWKRWLHDALKLPAPT